MNSLFSGRMTDYQMTGNAMEVKGDISAEDRHHRHIGTNGRKIVMFLGVPMLRAFWTTSAHRHYSLLVMGDPHHLRRQRGYLGNTLNARYAETPQLGASTI